MNRTSTSTQSLPPPVVGLFEVVLEVHDLERAERFYCDDLGLSVVDRWTGDRPATWLALGNESFLSLWPPETGGEAGIHGCRGGAHVHLALRVPSGTLHTMEQRLRERGHDVEAGWEFGPGNLAIYVDDPDGNVIELTERATLWDGSATQLGTP